MPHINEPAPASPGTGELQIPRHLRVPESGRSSLSQQSTTGVVLAALSDQQKRPLSPRIQKNSVDVELDSSEEDEGLSLVPESAVVPVVVGDGEEESAAANRSHARELIRQRKVLDYTGIIIRDDAKFSTKYDQVYITVLKIPKPIKSHWFCVLPALWKITVFVGLIKINQSIESLP